MIMYVQSPMLRKIGIGFFLIGLLSGVVFGVFHHFSGEVVATAETTKTLPQVSWAEQGLQAQSQVLLQNAMNKMGVPTYRTDDIQTLDMTFLPIHLSPDMGKVELQFEIHSQGIVAKSNIQSIDSSFKRKQYQLTNQASGKVIYKDEVRFLFPTDADEKGHTSKIIFNAGDAKAGVHNGLQYVTVGRIDVPESGDYVLHATLEKLKYAYPIESIKLIAKKGTIEPPAFWMIAIMLSAILIGAILCVLTTPPELRNKKKSNIRM